MELTIVCAMLERPCVGLWRTVSADPGIPSSPPTCQPCGPCRPAHSPAECHQLTQWRKKQVSDPQNCEKQYKWLLFETPKFVGNLFAAIHNENKIWYWEVGSCHHKNLTRVLGWVEALGKTGKPLRRLLIKARRTSKRLDESLEDRQWGKCYLETEFNNIITLSNMENKQDTQWTQESGWGYSRWKMEHTTVFFQLPMINYLKRLMD